VKARSSLAFGAPLEAVTERKAARLRRLAARWLAGHDLRPAEVRIDLVGVLLPPRGPVEIEHVTGVA
jgi:putative endonuclease